MKIGARFSSVVASAFVLGVGIVAAAPGTTINTKEMDLLYPGSKQPGLRGRRNGINLVYRALACRVLFLFKQIFRYHLIHFICSGTDLSLEFNGRGGAVVFCPLDLFNYHTAYFKAAALSIRHVPYVTRYQ